MVKLFFIIALLFVHNAFAEEENNETTLSSIEIVVEEDPLTQKIKSFLTPQEYEAKKDFINVIFDPKSAFYINERVDALKVVETLKENGLLNLFFKKPQEFQLNFKTNGAPLFLVKIMGDALRNIGYFRYVTTASVLDASEFTWSITIRSEYATDPLILQKELQKSGCSIVDIEKNKANEWSYVVDINGGYLNVKVLEDAQEVKLRRSLYAHWLDISKIRTLRVKSSRRNNWYPYIAYYDASLHLLKLTKENRIFRNITLKMPKNAKYIRISDLYTLKNVKDELTLMPKGSR